MRGRLIALVFGIALALAGAEYAVRSFDLGPLSRIPRPNTVDPEMRLHAAHPDVEVAWTLRAGAEGDFQGVHARVNSFGCRGSEPVPRGDLDLRIVTLGDSITFGAGVEEDYTFQTYLARRLWQEGRPADVLNCGVSGYNMVQSLRRYELDLAVLKPDVIVLGLFVDDLTAPYRMHDRSLRTRLRTRSAAFRALELGAVWVLDMGLRDLPPWAETDDDYAAASRERLRAWADARRGEGIRVLAAVHPPLVNLDRAPGMRAHPELADAAQYAALPTTIIEDEYRKAVGADLPRLSISPETFDPHPNAKGHVLVARALHVLLESTEVGP